jgi:hypothetical protein
MQRVLAMFRRLFVPLLLVAMPLAAQQATVPTQLTIYNQNFAVARTTVPLTLHAGVNDVLTTNVTMMLEPDSVVLRDPGGKRLLHILEQNYDAGVVTQDALLQKYEGKTIDFQVFGAQGIEAATGERKSLPPTIVRGKIVRADGQPLIEVDGHLQFQLPGLPLFPASTDGLLLKPTLRWKIDAAKAESFPAELDYVSEGFSWQATYNVVLPEEAVNGGAERAEIVGWVTIQNNSGTDFPEATIQLMAGDVAKIQDFKARGRFDSNMIAMSAVAAQPQVTQKAFDDFHLYDLHRTFALANRETKQVQFLDAAAVAVHRNYEFDASQPGMQPMVRGQYNASPGWDMASEPKVTVREEILNSEANHLGMPLPAGRIRFYRQEASGQMQFVGESQIDHTPVGQTLHLTSGRAFDLTGEQKQTDFHVDQRAHNMDESFAIKLHNAKPTAATVHVVEHLNRAANWQITEKSADYMKQDSATIEFPVSVPANGDATLTYSVHYSWQ